MGEERASGTSLWRMIFRNRLLIAGCTVLLVATTVLATSKITPRYEASASIRIDPEDSPLIDLGVPGGSGQMSSPPSFRCSRADGCWRWWSIPSGSSSRSPPGFDPPGGPVHRDRLFPNGRARRLPPRAPVDGRVLVRDRSTGDSVATATPSTPLDLHGLPSRWRLEHRLVRALRSRGGHIDFEVYSFDESQATSRGLSRQTFDRGEHPGRQL